MGSRIYNGFSVIEMFICAIEGGFLSLGAGTATKCEAMCTLELGRKNHQDPRRIRKNRAMFCICLDELKHVLHSSIQGSRMKLTGV